MTLLKHTKNTGAFRLAAASVVLASCSWSLPAIAADDAMTELLGTLRHRGTISEAEYQRMKPQAEKQAAAASSALNKETLKKEWFGKMSIRGYVQTRYTHVFGSGMDGAGINVLHSPTESNISERDSFLMRRARMIFSGDVHDHLYLYWQVDGQASVSGSYNETNTSGFQTRDMYGDVSLDHDKEHRIRIGISKVPYGFVNMQSSQNRLSIERPEALNSAVEGERDLGIYYMWADKVARERFRDLVRLGLKGSGDYGVFSVGAYNGQGLNRFDSNRSPHTIVHLAYPFQLDSGQYYEFGMSAYQGKTVVAPGAQKSTTEFTDRRAAANFVWYPQPFGMEAEWTVGEGPETVVSYDSLGRGSAGSTSSTHARTRNSTSGAWEDVITSTTAAPNRIETKNLHGGYFLLNYKADTDLGTVIPFTRWSYFNGARKFVANSPSQNVNEIDIGIEYQPWPSFEISLVFTRAFTRTNTSLATAYTGTQAVPAGANAATPAELATARTLANAKAQAAAANGGFYNLAKNVDRVTLQLQYNF